MVFEWLTPLSPIHRTSVSSLSQVLNFKHRFSYKDKRSFRKPHKEGEMGNNNKSDIEYIFLHGQINNYAVDDVLNQPDTSNMQSSFWTELQDRNETAQGCHHEAIGDFKTATEFNGCDGRKQRLDQQHCSDSTIMTLKWQSEKNTTLDRLPTSLHCRRVAADVYLWKVNSSSE